MPAFTHLGRVIVIDEASTAASLRLGEIREDAHQRAAALSPGGYWTTGLAVVLVALSRQALGTMTPERADEIVAASAGIWNALLVAENAIQAVLDGPGSDADKVAAIDAIWPAWPAPPGDPA
jgi:hypothetical protein